MEPIAQPERSRARPAEARRALEQGEIIAHFQPQVLLRTGEVIGVEALARWHHPVRGTVSPAELLPLLHECGLLPQLTVLMLDQARDALQTCSAVGRPLDVSVNLTPAELAHADVLTSAVRLIDRAPDGCTLTLEITEESVIADIADAQEVLAALRRQGVRISVDDFGTGYSSLCYLRDLPLDEVKLDRSFVQGAARDERRSVIVASTVELAHRLGLSIVAEGIEDAATSEWLRNVGCDVGQGFFHGRPMSLDDLLDWTAARSRQAPALAG